MKYDDLFLIPNLPKPLSQKELYDYFEKYNSGDKKVREIIIKHNIRLVLYEVIKKFSNTPYDEKDLISIGLIGLIKSIDTFDISKKIQFTSYSTVCIDNEILMFIKKDKKHLANYSLDYPIFTNENGKEIKMKDTLYDETMDFISDCEDKEAYAIIHRIVENLPKLYQQIIILYFGFENNVQLTQEQIANKLNISQSYTSKLLKSILRKISIELKNEERLKEILEDRIKKVKSL